MELSKKIQNYFNAAISAVFISSLEDDRVREEVLDACNSLKIDMWIWTPIAGFVNLTTKETFATKNLGDAFKFMREYANAEKTKVVFVLQDFHLYFTGKNPVIIDDVKTTIAQSATNGFKKMMVCHGADMSLLPNEIQHLFKPTSLDLPNREDLLRYAKTLMKGRKAKKGDDADLMVTAADAATGMTKIEAINSFALSLTKKGRLDPAFISDQKAEIIKKLGILEIIKHPDTIDKVGGLTNLKNWLMKRKCVFDSKAREFGIPSPGGVLIVGVPGTGKSLTAKCAGATFQRPIIRLDMGRLFGGVVGASEANTRKAIETIDAVAPCVLWIDEIEKGMSGTESSGKTDGGTGARVFGTLLTWMQEHKTTVFPIATANDVSKLPPELIRRFDEIFSITLPSHKDRVMIWEILIRKYRREPKIADLELLADASADYTGAEIEKCIVDALYASYDKNERNPTDQDFLDAIKLITPISAVMPEKIAEIVQWSKTRARDASDDHDKPKSRSVDSFISTDRDVETGDEPF